MHARVSSYDLTGATKEDAVKAFDDARVTLEDMPGNKGGMLLVDTAQGKALTITLWETEQALRDSAERANALRREAAGSAGMSVTAVNAYEVALEFGG
jgi:heme-degrading monooxygenase HmoA